MMSMDLTALLKEWGVTITFLSIAATALLVIFTLSFREFASWFVRVNQLLENQKEILRKLDKLESLVERVEFEKSPEIRLGVTEQPSTSIASMSVAPTKNILMGPTRLTAAALTTEPAPSVAAPAPPERFQIHS